MHNASWLIIHHFSLLRVTSITMHHQLPSPIAAALRLTWGRANTAQNGQFRVARGQGWPELTYHVYSPPWPTMEGTTRDAPEVASPHAAALCARMLANRPGVKSGLVKFVKPSQPLLVEAWYHPGGSYFSCVLKLSINHHQPSIVTRFERHQP